MEWRDIKTGIKAVARFRPEDSVSLKRGMGAAFDDHISASVRAVSTARVPHPPCLVPPSPPPQLDRVALEEKAFKVLYVEGGVCHVMEEASCEQLDLPRALFGEGPSFKLLQDGMDLSVSFYDELPVTVRLPDTWTFTVAEADPHVKGQSATASYKVARLSKSEGAGVDVQVPTFVEAGERIVLDLHTGAFVRRAG